MAKRTIPEVVVTLAGSVALFEPQSKEAARWLSVECKTEGLEVHDKIRVTKEQKLRLVRSLRQAGFWVMIQK